MLVVVAAAVAGALVAVLACLCIKRRRPDTGTARADIKTRREQQRPAPPPRETTEECPICCERIEGSKTHLSCAHAFCTTCIERWVRENPSCPVCRIPVSAMPPPSAWGVAGTFASTVPAAAVPSAPPMSPSFAAAPRAPPLAVGARVAYDRDGAARLGVVVAVHNEDPSGPYYTVRLDGPVPRDVQTERGRLRLVATPPRIAGSASLPGRAAQSVTVVSPSSRPAPLPCRVSSQGEPRVSPQTTDPDSSC
jgi:hypothetical protein